MADKNRIRVGSRDSALAVIQSKMAIAAMQNVCSETGFELITMKTTGDKVLDRPLDAVGGRGLFVKELDQALYEGRCELTVHSLKDMPLCPPEELPVLALLEREDCRDVLVLVHMARDVLHVAHEHLRAVSSAGNALHTLLDRMCNRVDGIRDLCHRLL